MRSPSNVTSALAASLLAAFVVACGGMGDDDAALRRGSGISSTSTSDSTSAKKPTDPAPAGTQGPGTSDPVDASSTDPSTEQDAGGTPTDPGTTDPNAPGGTEVATKKVLDIVWKGQETYYWCGPGSTRIALSARISADKLPTQTQIAGALPTTEEGTSHIGLVATYLNAKFALSGSNAYVTRPIGDPASSSETALLKKDILARIGAGFPLVANVVSGWRPPTYPGGTIYHYVAIVGYDDSGNKVMIADPAAEGHGGSSQWNGVPRTYWVSIGDLATWIGGKGYTG